MSFIRTLWKCTFGPRLFKVYKIASNGCMVDRSYEPSIVERCSDRIVICFAAIWSYSLYTIPLVAIFFYQRINALSILASGAGAIFIGSLAARGCSRANSPIYCKFLKTLEEANVHYNANTKKELLMYDFEFWAWPVDYKVSDIESNGRGEKLTLEKIASSSRRTKWQTGKEFIFTLPCKFLAYIMAHTLAIKMIYPGSLSVLNWAFHSTVLKGRIHLKLKYRGERYKVLTTDNNEIDTMLIDRRNKSTNGNILVIACEGNCSFYETGVMSTPLRKDYSVLGWNHPGFGSSTGAPYPRQEENAIDSVMRLAIDHLKFPEDQIILYGWSIGGYTATWGAMNYPSIHSLVLDATFDHVLPLAIRTMSWTLESLVRNIIRDYFNLDIAEQLNRYDGTVLLIRRTEDEVVSTRSNNLLGNRGNILLTKLLMRRYPRLFEKPSDWTELLQDFLTADAFLRKVIMETAGVDEKQCSRLIAADIEKNDGTISYASTLGQDCDVETKRRLMLFLITMYMKDQPSSHCTPLAVDLFHPGWNPISATSIKQ